MVFGIATTTFLIFLHFLLSISDKINTFHLFFKILFLNLEEPSLVNNYANLFHITINRG